MSREGNQRESFASDTHGRRLPKHVSWSYCLPGAEPGETDMRTRNGVGDAIFWLVFWFLAFQALVMVAKTLFP
jgi:hypothetical protein